MKCPNCGYAYKEFDFDLDVYVNGDEGEFYQAINNTFMSKDESELKLKLAGCPKCYNVFMVRD